LHEAPSANGRINKPSNQSAETEGDYFEHREAGKAVKGEK
jgi:hypothetical protein